MTPLPRVESATSRFAELCQAAPDAPLMVGPRGTVTRSDLDRAARGIAGELARLPHASLVALRSKNGPTPLAALLALRRLSLGVILVDAGTPDDALPELTRRLGAAASVDVPNPWSPEVQVTRAPDSGAVPPSAPARHEETAVVKLTSGSSGQPRGVQVADAALLADSTALGATFGFGPNDRFLATLPFSHSYGLSVLAIPALTMGTVLVLPDHQHPLRVASEFGARWFPTVPTFLRALSKDEATRWPGSLEHVVTAGEPIAPELAAAFTERTGRSIHVFYGASECGGISYDRTGTAALRGTVGRPIAGVSVALEPTSESEGGSGRAITVTSAAVASGYHPEPDARLDGRRFVTDDLARWVDGELVLCGRRSDRINVRGRKVEPAEVERTLRAMPTVRQAAVVEGRNERSGESTIKAVIVAESPAPGYLDVVRWCREQLAPYKVPRDIVFVDELPRTERGKLDRGALRDL